MLPRLLLVTFFCVTLAAPIEDVSTHSILDRHLCPEEIIEQVLAVRLTKEGKEANCDETLGKVFSKDQVMEVDVCKCSAVIDKHIVNLYDTKLYDCVLTMGSWNILEVSRKCHGYTMSETSKSAVVLTENQECSEGVTCFNGKCVNNKCECHQGTGTLVWAPTHALWVGEDCRTPWCPNDCNGHGNCDISTGLCVCDTTFGGIACDVPHRETALTNRAEEIASPHNQTLKNSTRAAAEANLLPNITPSPTPTPSLVFVFPSPSVLPTVGPCDNLYCGPNGYCDLSVSPPQCSCFGGYTGANCNTPETIEVKQTQ
eukprot:c7260_g1_i1.p1 GENE.c7260_g1_i1~~c7260_g1_i1.p1  ORF type:complete len:314 (+),score=80.86 c7260_g1_i1:23-964(+)